MRTIRLLATTCLASSLLIGQVAAPLAQARAQAQGTLLAQSDRRDDQRDQRRDVRRDKRSDDSGRRARNDDRGERDRDRRRDDRHHPGVLVPLQRGHAYREVPGRTRHYRNVIIVRPYGRWYRGYGHWHHDSDAYKWLAFTAITLALLDFLNESQQRAHEEAQIRATTAPIGETIHWNEGGASGSVTALREGRSSSGRYCREFQQTIVVGGRSENAYGTACQQPDGTWEIVSTGK